MSIIMFEKDKSLQNCSLTKINQNVLEIILSQEVPMEILVSGFKTLNEYNFTTQGEFYDYVTVYETFDDNIMKYRLSNNKSVAPEPIPDPEPEPPYIPTLEDVKSEKINEINMNYENALSMGTTITLIDGSKSSISITQDLQNSLTTAYISATSTLGSGLMIPFEINGTCNVYSAEDIIYMYIQEQTFLLINKSLKNDLIATINRIDDIDEVKKITYLQECLDEIGLNNMQKSLSAGQAIINNLKDKYLPTIMKD